MIREVAYDTDDYRQTIVLRQEILRAPLGLSFTGDELAAEQTDHHLACWEEEKLMACLVLTPLTGMQIRMRQLAVAAGMQGKGIGKELVGFTESFAKGRGYREIIAHARESAVPFYRKLGYAVEGDAFMEVTLPHYLVRKEL